MDKYQVMPPLTDQEYQELKSSIAQFGVQVAVEYDEEGNVLDGHHRLQACKELGIENIPKIVKVGMSEQQKLDYSLMVNTTRRQLTREQKQELIRQQLKRTPEKSDRQIASIINSDHKTVSNKRKEMESIGEIPQCNRQTTDGRIYPAQRKPITIYHSDGGDKKVATTVKEVEENIGDGLEKNSNFSICEIVITNEERQDSVFEKDENKSKQMSYDEEYADYFQEDEEDRYQKALAYTNKCYCVLFEKIISLGDNHEVTAQRLLETKNWTREELLGDLGECINRLQCIKMAVSKSNILKAVR